MRTGEEGRDLTQLEKKAGQKAARTLSRRLKLVLATATTKQTGKMLQSVGASTVMRFNALDHIALRASTVTFKQHYGFEGVKKNGVKMKLKAYNHFNNLFNGTNALEKLIDEVSDLRAEEITSKIKF